MEKNELSQLEMKLLNDAQALVDDLGDELPFKPGIKGPIVDGLRLQIGDIRIDSEREINPDGSHVTLCYTLKIAYKGEQKFMAQRKVTKGSLKGVYVVEGSPEGEFAGVIDKLLKTYTYMMTVPRFSHGSSV